MVFWVESPFLWSMSMYVGLRMRLFLCGNASNRTWYRNNGLALDLVFFGGNAVDFMLTHSGISKNFQKGRKTIYQLRPHLSHNEIYDFYTEIKRLFDKKIWANGGPPPPPPLWIRHCSCMTTTTIRRYFEVTLCSCWRFSRSLLCPVSACKLVRTMQNTCRRNCVFCTYTMCVYS